MILDESQLTEAVQYFLKQPGFSFDFEAMGEHRGVPHLNDLCWLSMATQGACIVIPMSHPIGTKIAGYHKEARLCSDGKTRNYTVADYEPPPPQIPKANVFEIIRPLFFREDIIKSAHGAVYDIASCAKEFGEVIPGPYNCTIVQAWLLDEDRLKYGLKTLTKDIYGFAYDDEEVGRHIERYPFGKVAHYSYCDAVYAEMLRRRFTPQIWQQGLQRVYELEMRVLNVLVGMRLNGAHVDVQRLRQLREELTAEREEREKAVFKAAGTMFNINSPQQKQVVLFSPPPEGQGLKPWKPTDTGKKQVKAGKECTNWSTDDEVLASYPTNSVARALRAYGDVHKLLSTYVLAYLGDPARDKAPQVYEDRIHADFVQYGTNTRRFSCREPNLQNIPRPDTELGKLIRGVWCADPGWKLIVGDYGQIELVMFAHYCGSGALYDVFMSGGDPHQMTADKVNIQRQQGKTLNFCVPMDTEALTRGGWKTYAELTAGDEVLGYDGENLHWTPVLEKMYFAKAPVTRLANRHWASRSTPQHRWVTDRRTGRGSTRRFVREMTATSALTSEHRIILSAPLIARNNSAVSASEAAIIAWLFTDGHVRRSTVTGRTSQGRDGRKAAFEGSIFQGKAEYIPVLDALMRDVPHSRYTRPTGIVQWYLQPSYLRELWKRARLDEQSLSQFVLSLGTEELKAFSEAAWQAEGWTDSRGCHLLAQNEGPVLEALHLAMYLLGYNVTRSSNGEYEGRINWNLRLAKPHVTTQRLVTEELEEQPVWCIRTQPGNWVMRQGGQIMLTGNSMSYGAGVYLVASMLGVDVEAAKSILEDHRREFPEIYALKDYIIETCRSREPVPFVRTLLGGIRRLPQINLYPPKRADKDTKDRINGMRMRAERQAVSAVIQGSAADLIKLAMVRADTFLAEMAPDAHISLSVHDEIVIESPEEQAEAARAVLREAMIGEGIQCLVKVPLTTDIKIVDRWSEAK